MYQQYCKALALLAFGLITAAASSHAQEGTSVNASVVATGTVPVTASELWSGFSIYSALGAVADDGKNRLPRSQLDSVLEARSVVWVKSLQARPVRGIQLDPMGRLAVVAGQDALAKQQFAERLSTPNLSTTDKAYALLSGVMAFGSKGANSGRMQTALEYLAKLDALPASEEIILSQLSARLTVADAYFLAGNGDRALPLLRQAFERVGSIHYVLRDWIGIRSSFITFADILSGRPNTRGEIDSVGAKLLELTKVPPDLLAKDPMTYGWMQQQTPLFQAALNQIAYLGRKAPDIEAQYWFNTTRPSDADSTVSNVRLKRMDDGKVRVLMLGHYGCLGCRESLPKVDRMRKTLPPNVEVWYVTNENDVWGVTRLPPDEIAERYRKYYVDKKGCGLPIALWIGERKESVEGGTANEFSPTIKKYDIMGWPTFVIVDGKGKVRSIRMGFEEPTVRRTVQYLIKEASQATASIN